MTATQFAVDPERCKRDGLCALECPMGIIQPDQEGIPRPAEDFDERCLLCGHCLAVCPGACLTVHGVDAESLPETDRDPVAGNGLTAPGVQAWMRARRSTRHWKDQPVERTVVERCLDTARYAPSGINMQPVHWLAFQDPDKVRRLAGLMAEALRTDPKFGPFFAPYVAAWDQGVDVMLRGAPHVIVAHADGSGWYDPTTDAVIALAHFELAAHSEGVGTCWAGLLRRTAETSTAVQELLGLPEKHKVYGALMFGWPKLRMRRLPPRKPVRVEWK